MSKFVLVRRSGNRDLFPLVVSTVRHDNGLTPCRSGYPAAVKIFKDIPRSGGYYQNADRDHLGSPGWLVQEADEFVIHHLERDRDVFAQLLTSNEYFVYHNMDAKAGQALINQWRTVYDTLKGTAWKTKPDDVMQEHEKLLTDAKILDPREKELWRQKRSFLSHLYWFQDTFGQGRTSFTRGPFTHGNYYEHSPSYSLPPTPNRLRYVGVETPLYKEPTDHPEFWDYPVQQPFKVEHRHGILTHPAWLIAFSANTASDPIRRGRWIREKLLAGVVPDVPITVDAKVPDDPHLTLRERVAGVTSAAACIKCHSRMNDLGYALELDGSVTNAADLIDRLAKSERARQSIIRHAFRFFLGRNERPSDSATLIAADRAYVHFGGSFHALVVSLLTSDSFMYRKPKSTP